MIKEPIKIEAKTLDEQAQEILKIAQEYGVERNFFFVTTFQRYIEQLKTLSRIEAQMKQEPALIEKEYVKSRKNLYVHPGINAYNSTASAANKTVETLIKIVKSMGDSDPDAYDEDPLIKILRGESVD